MSIIRIPKGPPPIVKIKRIDVVRGGGELVIVDCPHCGKEHAHGGIPNGKVFRCYIGSYWKYIVEWEVE